MKAKMEEVRNRKGKLIFKAMWTNGEWYVQVKDHSTYTLVKLQEDGKLITKDYEQEV